MWSFAIYPVRKPGLSEADQAQVTPAAMVFDDEVLAWMLMW
jgi:hypothetical protein